MSRGDALSHALKTEGLQGGTRKKGGDIVEKPPKSVIDFSTMSKATFLRQFKKHAVRLVMRHSGTIPVRPPVSRLRSSLSVCVSAVQLQLRELPSVHCSRTGHQWIRRANRAGTALVAAPWHAGKRQPYTIGSPFSALLVLSRSEPALRTNRAGRWPSGCRIPARRIAARRTA